MTRDRLNSLARDCWEASLSFASDAPAGPAGERTLRVASEIGPLAVEAERLAIAAIHLKMLAIATPPSPSPTRSP